MNKQKIVITAGDFNGVGPEIIVKALNRLRVDSSRIILVGSKQLFGSLNTDYEICEIPFDSNWIKYGEETQEAGAFSYNCLIKACELVNNGSVNAIVTAPVSKNAMHLAGYNFSGQTEVLEKQLGNIEKGEKAEMLFVCGDFRVLLLTRHVPLAGVKITKDFLIEKILRINRVLQSDFDIVTPKIALCSLNPHAGENGVLGCEELVEFLPAVAELQKLGICVQKPQPSDSLFAKAAKTYLHKMQQPFDVYCACYHDQGLIPVKMLAQDSAVNMTVGLNVIRTSPAHGTAYDIAGKNIADESSMICAIKEVL